MAPLSVIVAKVLTACGVEEKTGAYLSDVSSEDEPAYKSFGYYQGLSPTESRSASRTDGTYHQMPCITIRDIARGVEKSYSFWHGHGGGTHKFTVTADHFATLREGKPVEIFTDVIDGHRHALRISPAEMCGTDCG
jgi:hypothetical protein